MQMIAQILYNTMPGFGTDTRGQGDRGKQWGKIVDAFAAEMPENWRADFLHFCEKGRL